MSACNFTQPVAPNLCLGDSLPIFNSNFRALDEGLCRIPELIPGPGMHGNIQVNEHGKTGLVLSPTNSIKYSSVFDFKGGTTSTDISFNNITFAATEFSYNSLPSLQPYATFSEVLLEDNCSPSVSIFWTAEGTNTLTVYATNSSTSPEDPGTIGFNGSVNALLSSGNLVYVGGDFTTVGGVDCKKFCALNLNQGTEDFFLGKQGSLAGNPLSSLGDLESFGSVNCIAEYENLLIVGGSFQSTSKGRGLTILDRSTNLVYPFYVNGVVNDLLVDGENLYVGGEFDYINYSPQGVSLQSGLRVYTNGLIKISLVMLTGYPVHSIDRVFAENIRTSTLRGFAKFNTFATKNNTIYVGGRFEINAPETLISRYNPPMLASGLTILSANGAFVTQEWNPIVSGEVLTISIDGDYMYVGGAFNSFHLPHQFYSTPRINDASTRAYNAICFNVVVPEDPVYEYVWKPKFNGPVTKFAFHDSLYNSYIYCYGKFNKINQTDVGYIAAIQKSYLNSTTGENIPTWKVNLQRGPELINQSLLSVNNTLLVGGNFTAINNISRKKLARINKVGESLSVESLSAIAWDFGFKVFSSGTSLDLPLTTYISASAYPGVYGTVNETSFQIDSQEFKGTTKGDLLQMFVRRKLIPGGLTKTAYVLGWKVDFN